MKKYITLERQISAPRERVWNAWTNPEEVKQWWGPNGTTIPTCTMDVREGGELYIVMLAGEELGPMAGQEWPMRGTFSEVTAPEKLVFTNEPLDHDGNSLMTGTTTAVLEDVDGGTKLTVTTGAEGDAPAVEQMLGGMEQGWNQQLDKLVNYLA
jgi:uncharacterized protein YndB with AHSA1/START domain